MANLTYIENEQLLNSGSFFTASGNITVSPLAAQLGDTITIGVVGGYAIPTLSQIALIGNQVTVPSASWVSASAFITTAQTASYVANLYPQTYQISGSWASQSLSSSFATTAATANAISFVPVTAISASWVSASAFITTAQTASYVDAGNITTGTISNSRLPAQINVTGVTASFTGSHIGNTTGTASFASMAGAINFVPVTATSASWVSASVFITTAQTATYIDAGNITTGTINNARLPSQINVTGVTASLLGTASWSNTATTANAISFVPVATISASWVSASAFITTAQTASYVDAGNITTGTISNSRLPSQINVTGVTASLLGTASWSTNAITAGTANAISFVPNAATSASWVSASAFITTAQTASYIDAGNITTGTLNNSRLPAQINITGISASLFGTASYATNALNVVGGYVTASAIYSTGQAYISGGLTVVGNVTLFGTSSTLNISSSVIDIGASKIIVNTYSPVARYAGISAVDSGSSSSTTGSLFWDSTNNYWLFQGDAGTQGAIQSSSVMIGGPVGQLGSETLLTVNTLPKATTGVNIGDSLLSDNGTTLNYSGNGITAKSITASLLGTASNAVSSSYVPNLYPQVTQTTVLSASWVSASAFITTAQTASYIDAGNITAGTLNNARLPSQINVTGVTASLFGNASTATNATNSLSSSVITVSNNANYYIDLSSGAIGNQSTYVGTGLTFNPSTNILTTTQVSCSALTSSGIVTNTINNCLFNTELWKTGTTGINNYKIFTLPSSSTATADYIEADILLGGWVNGSKAKLNLIAQNRGEFEYSWIGQGDNAYANVSKVVAYQNNGSIDFYIQFLANQYCLAAVTLFNPQNSLESPSVITYPTPTDWGQVPSGSLVFDSTSTSYLPIEWLSTNGYVGIGTTSPVNKLDVVGNISCSVITASLFNGTASIATSAPLYLPLAGGDLTGRLGLVNITASQGASFMGNVGIGTTNPQALLQVGSGNVAAQDSNINTILGTGGVGSGIQLNSYNDTGKQATIENSNGQLTLAAGTNGSGGADNIQFNTANTARMIINNLGNVGIGTTAPGYKLDVLGQVNVQETGTGVAAVHFQNTNGVLQSGKNAAGTGSDTIQLYNDGLGVAVVYGGNVGIGTTSPADTLDVNGVADFRSYLQLFATAAPTTGAGYIGDGAALMGQGNNDLVLRAVNNLYFGTNNDYTNPKLTILANGNVGIGATLPVNKLDVVGNISCSVITASLFNGTATTSSYCSVTNYQCRIPPTTGNINGSNAVFTWTPAPIVGTEMIFRNGILQSANGDDYTISGNSVTFVIAPLTGDKVVMTYFA